MKIRYDKKTTDNYLMSSKYKFLRKRKYTNYDRQMMTYAYFVHELTIYEIKIFGKWFVYKIEKHTSNLNSPNHITLDYLHNELKHKIWNTLNIPENRLKNDSQ